jgi:uncharacterized protein (TIGR02301 family)
MLAAFFRMRLLIVISLALCLGIAPAAAQFGFPFGFNAPPPTRPRPQAPVRPRVKPKPEVEVTAPAVTTPYDRDLRRLSEILGALHFLRGICGSKEGQKWRNEAQALIEAEAPSGERHDLMVQSFNRGFAGFQESYRTCTPAANLVIRRYLQEGAKIARDITARYAN